jgi:uncharacterized membrane protein
MNIHPLFVHFPIALLVFYAILEIVRIPLLTRQAWYFGTKAVLLIGGLVGGFAALQTGELAEEAYQGTASMPLVELHSTFATAVMIVYGILAAIYLIQCGIRTDTGNRIPAFLRKAWGILEGVNQAIFKTPILILGSIAGLILITIVGALGGAIVYGPEVDPIVSFIYHLLFIQ